MSSKYSLHEEHTLYFTTSTVIGWLDVFTRPCYRKIIYDSLQHCRDKKGLSIHAYVIMSNHLHMIVSSQDKHLKDIFRDFKTFTSKRMVEAIKDNPKESRRKWMYAMFQYAGRTKENHSNRQFWQFGNHAIPLWSEPVIWQKLAYIHQNPVRAGWVAEPWHYLHSSARQYNGMKGEIKVDLLWN